MENAATPTEQPTGTPAEAPVAAPAVEEAGLVKVSKEKLDQLERDAARAATNQRKAALYDRLSGKGPASPFAAKAAPAAAPTEDEREEASRREDMKAERLIMRLAAEPKYRAILDADTTLRDMMMNNPLAVLPVLAPDALDAEDALSLVTEKLDQKLSAIQAQKPAATAPAAPATEEQKKPAETMTVEQRVEEASKGKHLESSVAGMIRARLTTK